MLCLIIIDYQHLIVNSTINDDSMINVISLSLPPPSRPCKWQLTQTSPLQKSPDATLENRHSQLLRVERPRCDHPHPALPGMAATSQEIGTLWAQTDKNLWKNDMASQLQLQTATIYTSTFIKKTSITIITTWRSNPMWTAPQQLPLFFHRELQYLDLLFCRSKLLAKAFDFWCLTSSSRGTLAS